jgi:hypothetical protein
MLLDLDFMPLDQIANMSLNGLRRLVATHDKTQTWAQMDEYSIALDLRNWVSASGDPPLSLCFHKSVCWRIFSTRVFLNEA